MTALVCVVWYSGTSPYDHLVITAGTLWPNGGRINGVPLYRYANSLCYSFFLHCPPLLTREQPRNSRKAKVTREEPARRSVRAHSRVTAAYYSFSNYQNRSQTLLPSEFFWCHSCFPRSKMTILGSLEKHFWSVLNVHTLERAMLHWD